jgi:hypothetical protein
MLVEVFAVLSLPRPRTLRLVCLTDNSFGASIEYAFAGETAVWLRINATGFRIVQFRGMDSTVFREAAFRSAVRAALTPKSKPPTVELPPPGTKKKRDLR